MMAGWKVTVVNNERNQLRELIGICSRGVTQLEELVKKAAVFLGCSVFLLVWAIIHHRTGWVWVGGLGTGLTTGLILCWRREIRGLLSARSAFCYELLKEDIVYKHKEAWWKHYRQGKERR